MVGTLQEFTPGLELVTANLERVSVYFKVDEIDEGKCVPILLSIIGAKMYTLVPNIHTSAKTYALLCNITVPTLPKEKSFDELAVALTSHFQSKSLLIMERSTSTTEIIPHCRCCHWDRLSSHIYASDVPSLFELFFSV